MRSGRYQQRFGHERNPQWNPNNRQSGLPLSEAKARPFFLYLACIAPHSPLQATDRCLARFPKIENAKRRTYVAMVSAVDDGGGQLLATLRKHGLEENTMVVFLSDKNSDATLYDLSKDIGEKTNFATSLTADAAALKKKRAGWDTQLMPPGTNALPDGTGKTTRLGEYYRDV